MFVVGALKSTFVVVEESQFEALDDEGPTGFARPKLPHTNPLPR